MTAFTEILIESGQTTVGGGDTPGSNRVFGTIRRFIVPGDSPSVVVSHPDLLLAAGSGLPHPSIPGLVSLGFVVEGRGGAGDDAFYYVRADYGIAGTPTFDFPAPDRQSLAFLSAGFVYFKKQVDFPLYVEREIAAPSAVGPFTSSRGWIKIEGKSLDVKCMAFQVEFNLAAFGPADVAAIDDQADKLHVFYGRTWRFQPVRADKLFREGVWNVVYRWESDPGHSAAALAPIEAETFYCEVAPRPPHAIWLEVFDVVYPETDSGPRLAAKVIGEVVPAGYQTLPGFGTAWNL